MERGKMETNTPMFRIVCLVAALVFSLATALAGAKALAGTLFGA